MRTTSRFLVLTFLSPNRAPSSAIHCSTVCTSGAFWEEDTRLSPPQFESSTPLACALPLAFGDRWELPGRSCRGSITE